MNELPVHNFIFEHSRRLCPNIYQVLEPASVSPSHRSLPPALWTTSWLILALRREHQSFPRRIHGTISSHFADSQLYHKQQQFVCEFPLDVPLLRWEIIWRNAPRIWWDFVSALPFQTRVTRTKPFLPLSDDQGSQVKDQGRRQCCHHRHKKFPYRPTRDVSLLSGDASYCIPTCYNLSVVISSSFRFPILNSVCFSRFSYASHMAHPSHPPRFHHPNNIRWPVQILQFSPDLWFVPCNLLSTPASIILIPFPFQEKYPQ